MPILTLGDDEVAETFQKSFPLANPDKFSRANNRRMQ